LREELVEIDHQIEQSSTELAAVHDMSQPSHSPESDINAEQEVEDTEAQRTSYLCTQDVLRTLLSDVHVQRTGQRIEGIEITDEGKLLVGHFGTHERKGQIQQDISNVKATKKGRGIVGVAEGLDINAFFK
jgi:hypothetical protein